MSEIFKGVFAASMSVLKADLSLDIKETINHAKLNLDNQGVGSAFFGSTGCGQLISVDEKKNFISALSKESFTEKILIGTSTNSLKDTTDIMKHSIELGFSNFLIMPPAYYKYGDEDVINFYSRIVKEINDCKIILYNFEKLCGYKFSVQCVENLVQKFPDQIIGVKDSSYNLFETLKIKNFSIFPGSEAKLLKGLELGCHGIITATTNVTGHLARNIYDNFLDNLDLSSNQNLCDVRKSFDKYNLISSLHTLMAEKNSIYGYLLPPLKLLDPAEKNDLLSNLEQLNFNMEILKAA